MNVLNDYTRILTPLIEGLELNNNELLVPILALNLKENKGTPIDLYKVRQSSSIPDFSIAKNWIQYPVNLHAILNGTGTYIVQILYRSAMYSGMMTYVDSTDANIDDEIPLHAGGNYNTNLAGDSATEGRVFAKVALPSPVQGLDAPYPQLFLACSKAEDGVNANITIKFRKLL